MTPVDADWFVAQYDHFVASQDDGAEVDLSREAVAVEYVTAVTDGRVGRHTADLFAEGRALFDRWVGRKRTQRRNSFRKDLEWLADALNGETILGTDDPAFAQAYPLGDGRDKCLGDWTVNDWAGAVNERNSNAVAVAAAAHEFQQLAGAVTHRMRASGAQKTSELFATKAAS